MEKENKYLKYIDTSECLEACKEHAESTPACLSCKSNKIFKESLSEVSGIVTSSIFWDCECNNNYIQHIADKCCSICGAGQDDQPESRLIEIQEEY